MMRFLIYLLLFESEKFLKSKNNYDQILSLKLII
jgi:hypothetical protein